MPLQVSLLSTLGVHGFCFLTDWNAYVSSSVWTLWTIQLTPSWSFCGQIWHLKPFFCMVPSSLLQCLGDFQVPLPPRSRSLFHLVILPAAVLASPSRCHRSEMSPGKSWGDSSAYQNRLYLVCIISTGFKYNFLIVGLPKPDFFWLLFDRMLSLFKKLLSLQVSIL